MKTLTLPGLSTPASRIALGTAAFGSLVPKALAFQMLDAFTEAGGTLIDTARVYADWLGGETSLSEKTIGAWLRRRGGSDGVIVATKGAHPDLATPLVPRLSPAEIVADIDASLARLGVERIDLWFLHRDDPGRPVEEIMGVLNAQVRAGKIGAIGCSNWQVPRIAAAQAHARAEGLTQFSASEAFWSLGLANPGTFAADHALIDAEALAFHRAERLPLLAYTSQARGYFSKSAETGSMTGPKTGPEALKPELRAAFDNPTNRARLGRAIKLARAHGTSVTAITLAALTSGDVPAIPIIGPLVLSHLTESLSVADVQLTATELEFLFGHEAEGAA